MRDGIEEEGPENLVRTKMMEILEERWKPLTWELPDDFLSYEHYKRVVVNLEWNSSPGYPWLFQYATNRSLFEVVDGVPSERALRMVWAVVRCRIANRDSDPIRLFIKAEPLKRSKLELGAGRLISSVSVVDQIVDGMLFGVFNDLATRHYLDVPAKVGWSPYGGGWKIMPFHGMKSLDKKAWDWTLLMWVVHFLFELRKNLMKRSKHSALWEELAEWRYLALFAQPLFVTSAGMMLRQIFDGVMKSGCFNTIVDNSVAQDVLHVRVCVEMGLEVGDLMSMGDDTTQGDFDEFPEYVHRLSRYCRVKGVVEANEFAGHRFKGHSVEPLYLGKHSYNLLHADPAKMADLAASYCLLYHRSQLRDHMRGLFEQMGIRIPSLRVLDVIYDGEA